MKTIFRNISILTVLSVGIFATSCEDMMTVDTGDKAYVNAQDTLYSYLGVMRAVQDVAERQVILGEIRGDLVEPSEYVTDTLNAISNFDDPQDQTCSMLQVSDYYNIINNCNFYIHNADTSAVKANNKFMVPEYAQVKAIRAWAYLQLVKNYRQVPYITEPVSNLDVINNFDYKNNVVNKDNLIDLVLEDGILDFVDTRYPQYGSGSTGYGSWANGFTDISARLLFIPIRVLLGDMYLLRGRSNADYMQAARYYYEYLRNETTPMPVNYTSASLMRTGSVNYSSESGSRWGLWGSIYTYDASTNEVVSTIPGSANAGLGKMLTRVADIFGYTPSSSQASGESTYVDDNGDTQTEKDANGSEIFESSGAIYVTRNYKRQYGPSNAYIDVVNHQTYVNYKTVSTGAVPVVSYIDNCDARYGNSVETYTYEGDPYPLCSKAARGSTFFYTIPTYRKTLIWLRMAEAINRAGYPEFAFALLKDGINKFTLPSIVPAKKILAHYDENGDTIFIYNEAGEVTGFESDTIDYKRLDYGSFGAMYYVTDTLKLQKFNNFLDFTDDLWMSTYGIHARGAGYGSWIASESDKGMISTNISGYRDSVYYDYSKLLAAQGVDIATASEDAIINGVENIIVDELALEMAFEGNRFTDLVRIAEHKEASGFNGVEWLARKIASRGSKAATSTSAAVEKFDTEIYNKLNDKSERLWFFSLPVWSK